MSAVLRQDEHGVLLRYHPDRLGRHHTEQMPQPSDSERIALIEAERELLALVVIGEHLDISDHGRSRIFVALAAIQRALDLKRMNLGMARAGTA